MNLIPCFVPPTNYTSSSMSPIDLSPVMEEGQKLVGRFIHWERQPSLLQTMIPVESRELCKGPLVLWVLFWRLQILKCIGLPGERTFTQIQHTDKIGCKYWEKIKWRNEWSMAGGRASLLKFRRENYVWVSSRQNTELCGTETGPTVSNSWSSALSGYKHLSVTQAGTKIGGTVLFI